MQPTTLMIGVILAASSSMAAASPEKDAVRAVIKTIKAGEDLEAAFPGAVTAREIASLQRVTKCSAVNLMKQKAGYYTVVWDCGSKGALGMKVEVDGSKVTSVSTMALGMRPNTDRR